MTVSTTDSVEEYVSGGPAFTIPYRFLKDSDIEAVLVHQDGASETLVLGTQYTLTGAGSQNGGTLTSTYAASVLATPGATLSISRVMTAVQPTDLRNQGRYFAETHENVFDRLTMLIQQGFSGLSRALKRPIGKNYYDAEGRRISNVGDPAADGDAVNKLSMEQYVGSVIGAGTGPVNLASNVIYIDVNGVPRVVQDMSSTSDLDKGAALIGYRGRKLREVLDDTVHCVDASLLQGLINDFKVVRIPHHAVLTSPGITIPNDRVLIVDGKLQLAANSPDGTKLITSASATPSNISIYGDGELDGNKANQSGASTKHTLVFFQDGDEISYQVRRARGNYFPRAIAGSDTTGMIYFKSCSNSEISNARGYDYGRECFWLEECSDCEMHNLTTFGGADSWSGFQCHGTRNRASNWLSYNAGASSGSFDTTYGEIHGWIGINNTFTNVINFGHTGKPASHSVATGLIAIGGSRGGTSNVCNGIQVGGGTIGLQIVNAQAHNSVDSGIQISDSASDITVSNFRAFNCGLHGVRLSGSSSIHVLLNDIRVQGCAGYAIRADGGIVAEVTGGKCISNTLGFIGVDGTSIVTTSMLRNGSDALFVGQSLVGMVVGTPITINNTNIHTNSRILLQASNAAGASAQPFVQSIGTGQMQIGVAVNATAGAFARIQIM